jgi:hypothetical protein
MPAIIDSAPGCVQSLPGATKGDDADFILQAAYKKCEGFMTFGPGSTYGDGGHSAASAYYVLTAVGIAVSAIALLLWVVYEHRQLIGHAVRLSRSSSPPTTPPGV